MYYSLSCDGKAAGHKNLILVFPTLWTTSVKNDKGHLSSAMSGWALCVSCYYSSVHPVAVDAAEGIRDSWSSQRPSLPMEPIKFPAAVWRVSKLEHCSPLAPKRGIVFVYLKLNVCWTFVMMNSSDFHDYHHRVLCTQSQGTMARHLFTWTGENPWHRCVDLCRGSELHYITSSSLVVFQLIVGCVSGCSGRTRRIITRQRPSRRMKGRVCKNCGSCSVKTSARLAIELRSWKERWMLCL
jgi:hypothetical protein